MIDELTEQQIMGFKEAFNLFDKDENGSISINQIEIVMKSMNRNVTRLEIQQMIDEFDVDGNGEIDFPEFLAMMVKRISSNNTEEQLQNVFKRYDLDGDGFINPDELREVQQSLGILMEQQQIEQLIERGDLDKDGMLSFQQFKKLYHGK